MEAEARTRVTANQMIPTHTKPKIMKINFTKPLTNYRGEPMRENGQLLIAKDVICNVLSFVRDAAPEDKLKLSEIARQIWNSKAEIDLKPEELALIRKHISHLPADMYADLMRITE